MILLTAGAETIGGGGWGELVLPNSLQNSCKGELTTSFANKREKGGVKYLNVINLPLKNFDEQIHAHISQH
jgi:hypothetical protein